MQRQKVDWRDGNRQSKSFFFLGTESRAEFTIWLLKHLVNLKSKVSTRRGSDACFENKNSPGQTFRCNLLYIDTHPPGVISLRKRELNNFSFTINTRHSNSNVNTWSVYSNKIVFMSDLF